MKISIVVKSIFSISLIFLTVIASGQTKEDRDLPSFSGISLSIAADVYLTQGSPQKVVIEADESKLDKIKTDVQGEVLRIKTDSWNLKLKSVRVWITVPEVEALVVSGSGKIMAETPINAEELDLKVSGSGMVKVPELKADEIDATISGSGEIVLAGTADELDISISGSGSMLAEGIEVDECSIKISGSGSCKIDATDQLDAVISGSGKVIYYGNPQIDARVSGSGKVKKGER